MIEQVQAARMRELWSAAVLTLLEEAVRDYREHGQPALDRLRRWADSPDGRIVLTCAGIDANSRTTKGLVEFAARGIAPSKALARD